MAVFVMLIHTHLSLGNKKKTPKQEKEKQKKTKNKKKNEGPLVALPFILLGAICSCRPSCQTSVL